MKANNAPHEIRSIDLTNERDRQLSPKSLWQICTTVLAPPPSNSK